MLSTIYSAAGGLESAAKTQEVLARNIANASHPGYKRASLRFADELRQATGASVTGVEERIGFEQGELLRTDAPLDLALEGDGFFTLQRPNGSLEYTRKGSFVLGADGRIATTSGLTVMGMSGPILLPPGDKISVQQDGTVINNGQIVDRLRISAFVDPAVLRRTGTTLFAESGEVPTAMPAFDYRVRQGYLESSNVNVLREMVQMIENVRAFQASQKTVSAADSAMRAMNESADA